MSKEDSSLAMVLEPEHDDDEAVDPVPENDERGTDEDGDEHEGAKMESVHAMMSAMHGRKPEDFKKALEAFHDLHASKGNLEGTDDGDGVERDKDEDEDEDDGYIKLS